MAKCLYKHCSNEALAGTSYCLAHPGGAANRTGGNIVPAASSKLNAAGNANFNQIKGWCNEAKAEVERLLAHRKVDRWLSLFFGGQNVAASKKVMTAMPAVLQAWHDGTKSITLKPVYDKTSTPNACDTLTGSLTVSPGFLTGAEQKWVLVHESSHGVYSTDNSTTAVVDIRYLADGDSFHNLGPADRLINADHYRHCVQEFSKGSLTNSAGFGLRDGGDVVAQPGLAGGARTITAAKGYASFVKSGTLDVLQLAWLELFSLMTAMPDAFHAGGGMPGWYKDRSKPILKGKSTSTLKNKDYVRFEALYKRSRDWITALNQADCRDILDTNLRGLSSITLQKSAANNRFEMTSYFQPDALVTDKELRRGVKQLVELILQDHPYHDVTAKDIIGMAVNAQKSRNQAGRGWVLGF